VMRCRIILTFKSKASSAIFCCDSNICSVHLFIL
jgi:hypothetical protein